MSDAQFNAYNTNQPRQDNFIYDGSNVPARTGNGGGGDNFIYDGSGGAAQNNAWAGEHPFFQRPTDQTNQPVRTEISPDGRTVNIYYINNAYFNGSHVNGGYDYRQNPQYNYMPFDQNYQNLREQQQMNYFNQGQQWGNQGQQWGAYAGMPQDWMYQRQMQEARREQQMIQYQQWMRQQEMMQYMNGGGNGYAQNYGWNQPYYGGYNQGGLNLSFIFGGHRHHR